jgi:hypothetical protein
MARQPAASVGISGPPVPFVGPLEQAIIAPKKPMPIAESVIQCRRAMSSSATGFSRTDHNRGKIRSFGIREQGVADAATRF